MIKINFHNRLVRNNEGGDCEDILVSGKVNDRKQRFSYFFELATLIVLPFNITHVHRRSIASKGVTRQ